MGCDNCRQLRDEQLVTLGELAKVRKARDEALTLAVRVDESRVGLIRERDEAYGRIVVLRRQLDDAETRLEIAGGSIAMLQDDAPDDPMSDLAESARRLVRLVSLMAEVQVAGAPGSVSQGRWVAEHREMRREWEVR